MTSSTSNFKNFLYSYIKSNKSLIAAILVVLSTEILILYVLKDRQIYRTLSKDNLLSIEFPGRDGAQKYIIGYKNYGFYDFDADILMVGDSSGLTNVRPIVVNQYLANHKLINFSCCADIRGGGHLLVAKNQLENNKKIKYLMVYVTPSSSPFLADNTPKNNIESHLEKLYSGPWTYFYNFPSLYFRKDMLEKIYQYQDGPQGLYINWWIKERSDGEYDSYEKFLIHNLGWMPSSLKLAGFSISKINSGVCNEDLIKESQKSDFNGFLKRAKDLADLYKVKLIVAFAPVSCSASTITDQVSLEIKLFKQKNPDIYLLNDFINTRSVNDFVDNDHLNKEASSVYSEELGKELKILLK